LIGYPGGMTPLRCETRRVANGMGLPWRYSLAALIVLAAILDAVWWVPAHERTRAPVPPRIWRCPAEAPSPTPSVAPVVAPVAPVAY
jgi:hypothetical protein